MAEDAAGVGAVIVAGGTGTRFGGSAPKQFLTLHGTPVLLWAVRAFVEHPAVVAVAVVLPPLFARNPPDWLRRTGVRIVAGGDERSDSVWNGMAALPFECDPILVHDGARPLVCEQVISNVIDGARRGGALAAVPVADTLKRVAADGTVTDTTDRRGLWAAQTPQGFPRELLFAAYRAAREQGVGATDDAALVERIGGTVKVVPGSARNLKITLPEDLALAEALATSRK